MSTNIKKLFLLLFSVLFICSFSDFNNYQSISLEHCDYKKIKNDKLKNNIKIPDSINIKINKPRKWFKNILEILYQLDALDTTHIPYELKDYYDVIIKVQYPNGINCKFNGRAKIHGGNSDHIGNTLTPSLRVELLDGHINNINKFVLFKKFTRLEENEIFITGLLRKLGFMAPLTFGTKVQIFNQNYEHMIFQERLTEQFLKSYKKRPGPILAGNKNRFFDSKIRNTGLSRILNSGGLDFNELKHKQIALNALDKLNFGYLYFRKSFETLGIDGGKMANLPIPQSLFLGDKIGYEMMSSFEAILLAAGGSSGLSKEDRRFYYNILYDRFEPIYYDGMVDLLHDRYNFEIDKSFFITDFQKLGATKARKLLLNLNYEDLHKDLKELNIEYFADNFTLAKINYFLDLLDKSLIKIQVTDITSDHINPDSENFFANNKYSKESEYDFKLAFGEENNNFLICNLNLSNCKANTFSNEEFQSIITSQFINFKNKKTRFVRKKISDFLQNSISESSGIKSMKKIEIKKTMNIYFNDEIDITVLKESKKINIIQKNYNGRIIVIGKNISDWNFYFKGYGLTEIDYKFDSNGIGGCLTFIDSFINNISIYGKNFPCPNSVHFINTSGTIDQVELFNSSSDAFDADFSNLNINIAKIGNTGGECIGVKQGKYFFNKVNLSKCRDRSISSGENSETKLNDVKILSSSVGLAAKDSSSINVKKIVLNNVEQCILAFKQTRNYSASYVITKKDKYFCSNNSSNIQKNSIWINN